MSTSNPPTPDPAAKQLPRKSGVVVPHSANWYQRLAAFIISSAIKLVAFTIRLRINDPHGYLQRKDVRQVIYCVWHNRLALCLQIYFMLYRQRYQTKGMAVLVSASKDGALLSQILENLGVHPVRGSSSRRGAQAMLELTSWTDRGYDIALTPDGPRGPRYVSADGPIHLARLTGLPIVPVSYHLNWKIKVKSWDAFQIPLPFARCEAVAGRLTFVPRDASDDDREKLREQFQAELRAITRD